MLGNIRSYYSIQINYICYSVHFLHDLCELSYHEIFYHEIYDINLYAISNKDRMNKTIKQYKYYTN
jgi:hypothetical protein